MRGDYPSRTAHASPVGQMLDATAAGGLCLLLAFGPLAFGAVQEWAMWVLELGTAAFLVLWAVRQLADSTAEIVWNPLFVPVLLFAALVAVQLVFGRTAYWYATWQYAMLWAAYGATLFLVTQSFRRTQWLRSFAVFMTAYGFAMALFAITQQFTWNGKIYWTVANRHGGWVYGPYVNHAHYAGLMELLVPIPIVFALSSLWRKPVRILFAFAALIMAGTIFLSQSLGGILAFAGQLVLLLILVGFRRRSNRQVLLLMMLCGVLVTWVALLSPGGLATRLARLHDPLSATGGGDRIAIVKDSLKMVAQRPVLGWGLGTFPVVYPSFRSFYTNYFVNAAHNDYVQVLVETGITGLLITGLFIVLLYREGLRNIERWRGDIRASTALAAAIGCTGLLIHGLSDFNLQIPANAALFFALAALVAGDRSPTTFWTHEPGA